MEEIKKSGMIVGDVNFCKHGENYSLSITVENCSVSTSSYGYDHQPGNTMRVAIFDMKPENMIELANAILKVAFKLQEGAK